MRRIDWQSLDRALTGQATADERAALEARSRAYPSAAGALAGLRRVGVVPDAPPLARWNVEDALAKVKLASPETTPVRISPLRSRRAIAMVVGIAAAAAALLIVVVRSRVVDPTLDAATKLVTAGSTARGQRLRVNLVDGTQVVLGPESRLSIAKEFERGARTVVMEGEAYFHVARDEARPFRLRAGSGLIDVLGTEFTVRAYRDDSTVRVVVVTGRVSVRGLSPARRSTKPVTLQRGDVADLDRGDSVVVTHVADPSAYLEWLAGRLDFDDAPLHDVAHRLERWYDVRIDIADSTLALRRVSASFTDQTLREVLRSLCGGLRARCVQDGRDVRMEAEPPRR
ncbi:MAG TPA: FecR domain-containing protein [Gemmatimonadaceae bacterium]|jgi:ferric-dicitrate binding protein FerR (iron transport regulator)